MNEKSALKRSEHGGALLPHRHPKESFMKKRQASAGMAFFILVMLFLDMTEEDRSLLARWVLQESE